MVRNVNGCDIHYEIKQNSNSGGIPVLLLHGWGCDLSYFSGIMDALQDQATLVALDFPAHGESPEPPQPWGVTEYARQVKSLLESLLIDQVDIIAHSFGGRVAIWLAAYEPGLVHKMVITGGAGLRKHGTTEISKRTARYKRLKAITAYMMKLPLLKRPMQAVQEHLVHQYGSPDYVKLSTGMRATFVKIISEDLTPLLTTIIAPTLLVWGSNDQETPLWMGETMERDIPDAGLVVFEGRSHYAFIEESARFILIVRQFFWGGDKG